MKRYICIIVILLTGTSLVGAQDLPLSQRMAQTAMKLWSDTSKNMRWTYEQGVVLNGIANVWKQTAEKKYFKYIQNYIDSLVSPDGTIKRYKKTGYSLDNILCGRSVLMLYNVLLKEKYYKAAQQLRDQLKSQPRNPDGGFWHKNRYPNQMWLDGLYMAEPFYAEYASAFHEDGDLDDIAKQFILTERHTRDPKTGLLYHAWDQSHKERWANTQTGLSQNFWGGQMAGMPWLWWMFWINFRQTILTEQNCWQF